MHLRKLELLRAPFFCHYVLATLMHDDAHNTPGQGRTGVEEPLHLLTTPEGPHSTQIPGHLGLLVLSVPKLLEVSMTTTTSMHTYLDVDYNL